MSTDDDAQSSTGSQPQADGAAEVDDAPQHAPSMRCRDGRRDALPACLRCVRERTRGVVRLPAAVMHVGPVEERCTAEGGGSLRAEGGGEDWFCAYVHQDGRVRWGWLRGTAQEAQKDRKAMLAAKRAGQLDELFADMAATTARGVCG